MTTEGPGVGDYMPDRTGISYLLQRRIETSLNIDSLIVSKPDLPDLPKWALFYTQTGLSNDLVEFRVPALYISIKACRQMTACSTIQKPSSDAENSRPIETE